MLYLIILKYFILPNMRIVPFFIFFFIEITLLSQTFEQKSFDYNFVSLTRYLNNLVHSDNSEKNLELIDSLYSYSMKITEDKNEAFFLLTMVTLPYRVIPLKIPYLGIEYGIPLPSVDEKMFKQKTKMTPGKLFFDSPPSGDRDKVPHFFGNAFLAHSFGYFNISKFMGIFIELFERAYISSGEFDLRDFMINGLGNSYGLFLRHDGHISPGNMLKLYSIYYFRLYN